MTETAICPERALRRLLATLRDGRGELRLTAPDVEGTRWLWVTYPPALRVDERPALDALLNRHGLAVCLLLMGEEREAAR
jgi:hypothetical protein